MPFGRDRDDDRRNDPRTVNHFHHYIADPKLMQKLEEVLKALGSIDEVVKLTDELRKSNDAKVAAVQKNTPSG